MQHASILPEPVIFSFRSTVHCPSINQVDARVMTLIDEARKAGLPVTRDVLKVFGKRAADGLKASPTIPATVKEKLREFSASDKWVRNLVERDNLKSKALHGESGSADAEACDSRMRKIRELCFKYDLKNMYNVDETGLFYKLLPKRTYLSRAMSRKTVRGNKDMKSKGRMSLYVCVNADGSLKVPMSAIGKAKNPRCFWRKKSPIKYFSQANAWSDSETFENWWNEVFLPFARRQTSDPVLLLMDGCASHGDLVDPRGQVGVGSYPPNSTSKHQPADMGIIAALKMQYRSRLLSIRATTMSIISQLRAEAVARKLNTGEAGLAEGYHAHVLDACELC